MQKQYYNKNSKIIKMRSTSNYQNKQEWKQKEKDIEIDQYQQSQQSQDSHADNHQQPQAIQSQQMQHQNDQNGQNVDIAQKKNGRTRGELLYNSMINDFDNGVGLNRKRREIKMERQQLTQLFYELVTFVNNKVNQIGTLSENPVQNGKNVFALKNKKSIKGKKQDQMKPLQNGVSKLTQQIVPLPRKQSIKQQRLSYEKAERSRKKIQVFENYEKIMSYKLHTQKTQDNSMVEQKKFYNQRKQDVIKSASSSKTINHQAKTNKIFCVVQSVSLMIEPNFHGISTANSNS